MGEARRRVRRPQRRHPHCDIYDDASDVFHVKHEQILDPILDSIARDRETMANTGVNKLTHRIPTVIYEELQRAGIADDEQLFKAWLNSSDADPWRIEGQVVMKKTGSFHGKSNKLGHGGRAAQLKAGAFQAAS